MTAAGKRVQVPAGFLMEGTWRFLSGLLWGMYCKALHQIFSKDYIAHWSISVSGSEEEVRQTQKWRRSRGAQDGESRQLSHASNSSIPPFALNQTPSHFRLFTDTLQAPTG